jgi:hypothetical protein
MLCGAKLRGRDAHCQKHGMFNGRCRLHGGLSPKGQDHWNFRHGWCTKEQRIRNVQSSAELKKLNFLMIQLGMLEG